MGEGMLPGPRAFAQPLQASIESSKIRVRQSPPARTRPTHPISPRSPSPIAVDSFFVPSRATSRRSTDNPQISDRDMAAPGPHPALRRESRREPPRATHLQSNDLAPDELKA